MKLVINCSPRSFGNTFGILESMAMTNDCILNLSELDIRHCCGELYCEGLGQCCRDDDWKIIDTYLQESEELLIGSPIYMGQISSYCKVFIERCRSYLSYIEALDRSCTNMGELLKKHPELRDEGLGNPTTRLHSIKRIRIILTQSQPDSEKYPQLKNYLLNIFGKIFNTKYVTIKVFTGLIEKNDFKRRFLCH